VWPSLVLAATTAAPGAPFSTFYLFATALAVGASAPLLAVPLREIGRRFFILITFISIVFIALALAASELGLSYFYVAFAGLMILYNVVVPAEVGVDVSARRAAGEGGARRSVRTASHVVLTAAIACGVLGLLDDARSLPPLEGFSSSQTAWIAATFVSSSLVLGGALTAMVLGHWYLVARGLSFTPLARVTAVLLAALVLRLACTCGTAWAQGERWQAMVSLSGPTGFLLAPGIFLLARAIFGFLAPLALGWMAWRCIQLKANQSATGILYVIVAFVLVGEIIAKYFLSQGLVI
jgi:hypothetical protein